MHGELIGIELQISRGVRTTQGRTPLHCASQSGHAGVILLLLHARAEVQAKAALETTPLHVAAHGGHLEGVASLLGAAADVNSRQKYGLGDGHTVLHAAAERGHTEVVAAVLRARANMVFETAKPGAQNNHGLTPL